MIPHYHSVHSFDILIYVVWLEHPLHCKLVKNPSKDTVSTIFGELPEICFTTLQPQKNLCRRGLAVLTGTPRMTHFHWSLRMHFKLITPLGTIRQIKSESPRDWEKTHEQLEFATRFAFRVRFPSRKQLRRNRPSLFCLDKGGGVCRISLQARCLLENLPQWNLAILVSKYAGFCSPNIIECIADTPLYAKQIYRLVVESPRITISLGLIISVRLYDVGSSNTWENLRAGVIQTNLTNYQYVLVVAVSKWGQMYSDCNSSSEYCCDM